MTGKSIDLRNMCVCLRARTMFINVQLIKILWNQKTKNKNISKIWRKIVLYNCEKIVYGEIEAIDMIWIQIIMQVLYQNLIRADRKKCCVSNVSDWNGGMEEVESIAKIENSEHNDTREGSAVKSNKYFSVEISHVFDILGFFVWFVHVCVQSTVSHQVIQCHIHIHTHTCSISIDLSNQSGIQEILTTIFFCSG